MILDTGELLRSIAIGKRGKGRHRNILEKGEDILRNLRHQVEKSRLLRDEFHLRKIVRNRLEGGEI